MRPAVMLAVLLLLAQAPAPKTTVPTFLETLEVRVTNVDVVVTDREGKAVRGLRQGDFEVLENGVPQAITNFAEYSGSRGVAEAATPAPAATATGTPAPAEASAPPPRKFLFFVDEMSLNQKTRKKLTENAVALVRDQMRPGDEAMVITPATAGKVALDFTGDRAAVETRLREVIEAQGSFRAGTRSNAEQFFYQNVAAHSSSPGEYMNMARVYATRVNRRVTSTLRTLLGVVGSLNQTAGKKVLVVIGDSIPSQPGSEAFTQLAIRGGVKAPASSPMGLAPSPDAPSRPLQAGEGATPAYFDVRPMIRDLGARAAANGVTMYTVQPDLGVPLVPPGDSADTHGSNAREGRGNAIVSGGNFAFSSFHRAIVDGTQDTLKTLADQTGGKYFIGELQLDNGFRQIAEDLTSYYSLAYRTEGSGDDAFRKIEVRVKNRPELVARARREMLHSSPEREMDEMVAANLVAPRQINELGITASAAKPQRSIDSYKVDVAVKIPLAKLTFIPVGDKYRASFSVHYAAADGADYTTGTYREQTLQVPANEIDAVRTKMYTYTSTLVVAPGTARIAVGVYDKFSRLSGFQRIDVVAR